MNDSQKIVLDVLHNKKIEINKYFKINWKEVFDIIVKNKIFFIVYDVICDYISYDELSLFENQKKYYIDKNIKTIETMLEINKVFKREKINFVFSKGAILSKLIYSKTYYRPSVDIDIVVNHKDFTKSCFLLKDLGFFEINLYRYEDRVDNIDEYEYYDKHNGELTFYNDEGSEVELKTNIVYFNKDLLNKAWDNHIEYMFDINNEVVSLPYFCLNDVFINLLLNSFKNLCTPYGIGFDHRICDIVDYYNFCVKYKSIFTKTFVNLLTNEYSRELMKLYELIEQFYTSYEVDCLPDFMKKLKSTPLLFDDMRWNICSIEERFINSQKKNYEHNLFRFNNQLKKLDEAKKIFRQDEDIKKWEDIYYHPNVKIFFDKSLQYSMNYNDEYVNIFVKQLDEKINEYKLVIRYVQNDKQPLFREFHININNGDINFDGNNDLKVNKEENVIRISIPNEKLIFSVEGKNNIFIQIDYLVFVNKYSQNVASIGNLYHFIRFELN